MQQEKPQFDMSKMKTILILAAIALIIIFIFGKSMFVTIQPGEAAVIFRPFSTKLDKENIFRPGFQIIAPWNNLIIYQVSEQKTEETMEVLDKNGLSIAVEISIRYQPVTERIGFLYEKFIGDYKSRLVSPELRSAVRKVMGRYTAEEIYSTKRKEVENNIEKETADVLARNDVTMTAMLIRSINLPSEIKQAIENKLKQEQEALAYQFKLEKEKSEAERKRIAAEGESRANKIINNSLTPQLLKMRGIEATLELSKSPNSKTVIIGSGKDGMPMILGNN